MRKILLILILTFVSLLAFTSCENEEEKETIVGTSWVWQYGGEVITICFIDEYYATKTFHPYAVYTREYTYDAESQDGVIGGFIFTIRGNILTCNNLQYYKQ